MNFKVGDKVKIRAWEDMKKEFGLKPNGNIKCSLIFTTDMKHLCGRVATIRNMSGKEIKLDFENTTGDINWNYSTDMIAPVNQTIVIYRKGAEVIALDKTTGNKAVAKCSPEDTFDFETGAKLAFERLYAPKVKEVKRKAKVGEYVKVVNANGSSANEYKNGDILKIVKINGDAYYKNECGKFLFEREYVVLEGYEPPTEKKKAEVVREFKEGKIYVFRKELLGERLRIAGRWAEKCDGKIVRVNSMLDGCIDGYSFNPEWCEELPFAIGDSVKVTDAGETYNIFRSWKGLGKYEQNFVCNTQPVTTKQYKVINIEEHGKCENSILALIQDTDTTQVFIINIKGIEKV